MHSISPKDLKPLLTQHEEIALLDVREQGQYGEGHPFFSVSFPYSRLEKLASTLLPGKHAHLVLLDDGDGVAERAAGIFESLGYRSVSILEGGAPAWAAEGYTLYKGVNVPSKTYGELLEHAENTPSLTAAELSQLLATDPSTVVLDGRSPAEFQKMSLPGALSCPNAELGYRIRHLVPDESTTIVINCAGRTRSILGAEGLRMLNIKNPVYALENGTQGWRLAGFDLQHGAIPGRLPEPNEDDLETMATKAATVISSNRLPLVSAETVAEWQGDSTRTTYLMDVRTEEEFQTAHWPGARHAAGGQLVQATDQYAVVRNARIVLSDDVKLRAATTAVRLREMGHDVYILDSDARNGQGRLDADRRNGANVNPESFPGDLIERGVTLLDASPGMSYRDGHIDGATWVTRARVHCLTADVDAPLWVTGRDAVLIEGVVTDLKAIGYGNVMSGIGSPKIWSQAGYDIAFTPEVPSDEDCIDYLFFVHDRHDGNLDAARRYLAWETGLVDQLDEQERSVLNPGSRQARGQ